LKGEDKWRGGSTVNLKGEDKWRGGSTVNLKGEDKWRGRNKKSPAFRPGTFNFVLTFPSALCRERG